MGRNLGSLGIALISGLISLVGAACAAGNDTPGGTGDSGMDARAADGGGVDTGPRTDTGPAPDTGPRPDTGPSVPDTGPPVDAGMTAICDRCIDHAECGPLARCIQLTGGTRVCAPTCVPDIPTCGRGFQCVRNFAVSEDLTVCVPVGERCCLDEDDDDYGIGAGCDGLDCDDAVMSTFPGAREECNGVDDDCDGNVDMPLAMGACDGGRMCVGGACTCPDGLTDCAEAGCVDTDTDVANCGTCGNECPASAEGTAACSGGECGTACGEACAPFACDGDSGLCFDTCTDSSMCATGFDCRMGMCLPGPGSMCTMDSECASGFCTDGYCCRTRCDGDCEVCNLPTREGYCDPAPAGEDPRGDCEADDISTCDRDGTCDGSRRCALYPEGRVCQPPTCMGAMSRRAGHCDGFGNCDPGMSDACPPYVCDAASGMCNVSCDDTSDCIAGYDCALG
ncbi:MAG: putative metal-binding motif-containing protein, partial [Deltaproteobacteria bacterium]|nr:putative metal-binding motif-containing protein [Deltaproteobacteria bacterium]